MDVQRSSIGLVLCLLLVAGCARATSEEYHVLTDDSFASPAEEHTPVAENSEASRAAEAAVESSAPATVELVEARAASSESQSAEDPAPSDVAANPTEPQDRPDEAEKSAGPAVAAPAPAPLTAAEQFDRERAQLIAKLTGVPASTSGQPNEIKVLVPEKEFRKDPVHQALRVTFDDIDLLKVLNMAPVPPEVMDYLPGWLTNLSGQRIVLRGWMYPPNRATGIRSFVFVRDNGVCCFGPNAKIYDKLAVTMRDGMSTHFIEGRPFDVVGTLSIEPEFLDGELFFLYRLNDALAIDK